MGEKKKQSGSCARERGRTEKANPVRTRLMWVACLSTGAWVLSRPRLLPRARSGSMVRTTAGVDTSMTRVATKCHRIPEVWANTCLHVGVQETSCHQGHANLSDLHCHLGPRCHLGLSCCHWSCLGPWPCAICDFSNH